MWNRAESNMWNKLYEIYLSSYTEDIIETFTRNFNINCLCSFPSGQGDATICHFPHVLGIVYHGWKFPLNEMGSQLEFEAFQFDSLSFSSNFI